jgi:heme/copper-type cytochrome/quinol oxidase subunit 3
MQESQPTALASQPLVPSGVLAMVLFIATEAMFFAGLVSAFLVLRAEALTWPPLGQPRLPLALTIVNTLVLVASGGTMQWALAKLRAGEGGLVGWLSATAALGALFLAIQGYEWVRLVGFGLTTTSSLYGATFYTLVGAHGLHVLAALIVLVVVLAKAARGRYTREEYTGLELCRMYWLFVVAVWPILFLLVYVI